MRDWRLADDDIDRPTLCTWGCPSKSEIRAKVNTALTAQRDIPNQLLLAPVRPSVVKVTANSEVHSYVLP